MFIRTLTAFLIIFCSHTALAGEGLNKLNEFTRSLNTLHAYFVQIEFGVNMLEKEVARGEVWLQKPGKFRWDYNQPYRQQIIADGEKLWIYDIDLEQVTVKPLTEALGAAPIALLTGEKDLSTQFDIVELGQMEGREFLQLTSKTRDTDYSVMLLAFDERGLAAMELKNGLGQVTRIVIVGAQYNLELAPEQFKFVPPVGIDIIGQ